MSNIQRKLTYKLYDFDRTIYDGDSAIDFYVSCVRMTPTLALYFPVQLLHLIAYLLRLESKDRFKGHFFGFIRYIKHRQSDYIDNFWRLYSNRIQDWYKDGKDHANDVVVSASPSYYLNGIIDLYGVGKLIATEIDNSTGKLIGRNCYGEEKVKRIRAEMPDAKFAEAYTDSLSDLPMLRLAKKAYLVKIGKVEEYIK